MNPGTVRYPQGEMSLLIHRNYCKGCRICVVDCPEKILRLDQHAVVVVTEIGRCIFCGVCAVRCPDFAIALERPLPPRSGPYHDAGGMACA